MVIIQNVIFRRNKHILFKFTTDYNFSFMCGTFVLTEWYQRIIFRFDQLVDDFTVFLHVRKKIVLN